MHAWKLFRAALVTAVAGATLVTVPVTAHAAPPTSAIEVSTTSVARGETFTIKQTVYNSDSGTVLGGKATLYAKDAMLPDMVDLVSCPEATACDTLGTSVRAGTGDVLPGASKTITFTFRVKDDAPLGTIQLQHQFVGENFSFEIIDGPELTIKEAPADVAVSLSGKATGAKITYTIGVKNNGPGTATGVRVVGTFPANLAYVSTTCARVGSTRSVNCDIASLASGESATRTLTVQAGLLTIGTLTTTAQRTVSAPTDPVVANDKASKVCRALTWLIVSC
ncbi:DUF11 domain-containing protein [Kribbella jiaozuonensis]|uniref:DUF11 domain-containing protein n=1 Tax=Kribbella jiaozuonensis TaxID=2575441 RepID=A0A4U3M0W2_9ACTN|nr:DUF11 domain-containing protein [Kribbella jiaozuonensis]TKK81930.1 DUF11 domain-containing protein [Kribbella jiaozuonensis]